MKTILAIQNALAIHPGSNQGYSGDVYERISENGNLVGRFFVNDVLGKIVLDEQRTKQESDGYWYLSFKEESLVYQGFVPDETFDFLYQPNPLGIVKRGVTIKSPLTERVYENRTVYGYRDENEAINVFFIGNVNGRSIPIALRCGSEEFEISLVHGLPVIQHFYDSWSLSDLQ